MARDLDTEIGMVTHEEAEQIALAYIDVAFNNTPKPGRRVKHSIPVRASDTDVRLMHYIKQRRAVDVGPVPLILTCPMCMSRHIDEGEFATKPHHTHACQTCGHVWRPAIVATVGVQFLPGFKNEQIPDAVVPGRPEGNVLNAPEIT